MKTLKVISLTLLTSWFGFSQQQQYQEIFWAPISINGQLELISRYNTLDFTSLQVENEQESSFISGKLQLNTKSYFWHPNFLTVNLNGIYNPAAGKEISLLLPDYGINNASEPYEAHRK